MAGEPVEPEPVEPRPGEPEPGDVAALALAGVAVAEPTPVRVAVPSRAQYRALADQLMLDEQAWKQFFGRCECSPQVFSVLITQFIAAEVKRLKSLIVVMAKTTE